MIKKTFLAPILLLGCGAVTFGKVGENDFQIENRYGKALRVWDDYLGPKKLYHWRGYEITVNYVNGISQREAFMKMEKAFDNNEKFLAKISGLGKNGVILNEEGNFTTRAFDEKYAAARKAAWSKAQLNR